MIRWELPETRHEFKEGEGPQPFHRWRKYTLSLHDSSNLRKDIESWRGRSFRPEDLINFDLFVLLGRYCHLQIQHEPSRTTGQMYDRIERILPSETGTVRTPPSGKHYRLALTPEGYSQADFNNLPDWLKNLVRQSPEWLHLTAPQNNAGHPAAPAISSDYGNNHYQDDDDFVF